MKYETQKIYSQKVSKKEESRIYRTREGVPRHETNDELTG